MVAFSSRVTRVEGGSDSEDEPGESNDSMPLLKVGEESEFIKFGFKKKLLNEGVGWHTPYLGDEVTVHYVGSLPDGSKFVSTRCNQEPLTFKLGHGKLVNGLDRGITTMTKGEKALFTLPPDLAYGVNGSDGVPPNSVVLFEVELVSWLNVIDVCNDGGIVKKVSSIGLVSEQPSNLDQVTVKFEARLLDGPIIAKTPDEGVEFYVNDGYFCLALSKAIKTMRRGEKALLTVQPPYGFGQQGYAASDGFSSVPPNSTLVICLELVSIKPVINVTGDLKVLKKIRKAGEGIGHPDDGSLVHVRYTGMLEDGTIFESKGTDVPFAFIVSEEQVIKGLDQAVATMRKGERSVVTVKPDFGYGGFEVQTALAKIPPSSTLTYEVEMVDFTKEKELYEMTDLERVKAAEGKKEEGNKLYKTGKYRQAVKRYWKAAGYLIEEKNFGDCEKQVQSLRISIWLNVAACRLKLNDYKDTITLCSEVLESESQNVKALFSRAQAYMQMSDLDLADLDVRKAIEIDPQNSDVKSTQEVLKQLKVKSNKRDTQLYSTMVSKLSEVPNTKAKRPKNDNYGKQNEEIIDAMAASKPPVLSTS